MCILLSRGGVRSSTERIYFVSSSQSAGISSSDRGFAIPFSRASAFFSLFLGRGGSAMCDEGKGSQPCVA